MATQPRPNGCVGDLGDGADLGELGRVDCEDVDDLADAPYVSLTRSRRHANRVTATDDGELWLIVGTDSGFEGRTELYYQRIDVTLTPTGVLGGG